MVQPSQEWSLPPLKPALDRNDVHVWRFSLEPPEALLDELEPSLSPEETERAGRFHFERDRLHYIAAHGCLRDILARYLDTEGSQLCFRSNEWGKPDLAVEFSGKGLAFNLSHSGQIGLLAVVCGRSVGVDIEHMRSNLEYERLARRFFSTSEAETLLAMPGPARMEAFFTAWTRKEAYIKARGKGLSLPLNQFDVSLIPGEPARLLGTRPDPSEAAHWSLRELNPGPGYVAALAVRGSIDALSCWQWTSCR